MLLKYNIRITEEREYASTNLPGGEHITVTGQSVTVLLSSND